MGNVPFGEMGLPGPDLDLSRGGRFCDFYSPERRRERVGALYNATADTYRQLCEVVFPDLSRAFLYGQGPIRAVLYVDDDAPGWSAWWEPVASWEERAVIVETMPDWDVLFERIRAAHVRLGRDTSRASMYQTSGKWAPLHPEVTETVAGLLEADLAKLSKIIEVAD